MAAVVTEGWLGLLAATTGLRRCCLYCPLVAVPAVAAAKGRKVRSVRDLLMKAAGDASGSSSASAEGSPDSAVTREFLESLFASQREDILAVKTDLEAALQVVRRDVGAVGRARCRLGRLHGGEG